MFSVTPDVESTVPQMALSFGASLREKLKARGIKPTDFARQTGVSPQQVNKWLEADNVELGTLLRIAKGLGVSVESLCSGIDAEYDAMRQLDRGPARVAEVFEMIPKQEHRDAAWRLLLTLAGVPGIEPQ